MVKRMTRTTMRRFLIALIVAFGVSTMAEAAPVPPKTVRHRTKHSSRVSSGQSATTKKPAPETARGNASSGSNSNSSSNSFRVRTTQGQSAKPAAKKPAAKHPQSTKPR